MSFELTDFDDRPIRVGTLVRPWDWRERRDYIVGTVLDLGEWDGDHDDEGRSVAVAPRIAVAWDDGITEHYPTSEWEFGGLWPEREPLFGRVEEVVAIGGSR